MQHCYKGDGNNINRDYYTPLYCKLYVTWVKRVMSRTRLFILWFRFLSRDVNVHDVTKCKYLRNLLHFDEIFLVLFKKKKRKYKDAGEDFV